MILKNKTLFFNLFLGIALGATSANAAPNISSPYVSKGETVVEWKNEYKITEDEDDSWGSELEAGYAFTDFWLPKVGVEYEGDGEETEFTNLVFDNKFQLAPKGALFVDPGLKLEYVRSLNGGRDGIEGKLLLAKEIGKFMNKSAWGIEHEFGDGEGGETTYNFSYGLYYDCTETFEIGGEWYSDFGNFEDDFDDQSHKVGPIAVFALGEEAELETGALFGVSDAAPDVTLKAILEYEF